MSSSHLLLGLPIALLVLYFELPVSISFFYESCSNIDRIFVFSIFSMASSMLLFMYSIQSSSSITVVSISSAVSFSKEIPLS